MKLLVIAFLLNSTAALAMNCTAKVANRTYQVTLNEATRELMVDIDTGAKHVATANLFHSIIQNADIWSVPTGFNGKGIEVVWDIKNAKHWVCLTASECYGCS